MTSVVDVGSLIAGGGLEDGGVVVAVVGTLQCLALRLLPVRGRPYRPCAKCTVPRYKDSGGEPAQRMFLSA